MGSLSDAFEIILLQFLVKETTAAVPTALAYSLHSADPGDTGANEISGNSYARAALNPDPNAGTNINYTAVADEAGGTGRKFVANAVSMSFPTATGPWNGGSPISFCGMWDTSNGRFVGSGTVSPAVTVLTGNQLIVSIGNLNIFVT